MMWHRLADHFKDPNLSLTWQQFCDWVAYFELSKWPDEREQYRTALILERITNMAGNKVRKPVKVEDFMPKKSTRQTPEQQKAFLRGLANG